MKRVSKASSRFETVAAQCDPPPVAGHLTVLQGQLPSSSRKVKALAAVTALLREKGMLSLAPMKRPARQSGWRRG